MRDKEFFSRRDTLTDELCEIDLADPADRIGPAICTLVEAVLLLAQVIQERPDSGAEHCLTPKKVS